jgi:F0F1-type ATP synthase assembly protein I
MLPEAVMRQVPPVDSTGTNLAGSLRVQSLVMVLLALVLLLVSPVAAYSSLFGGLAVYLPGLIFTVLVVRKMGGDSAAFLGTAALAEFGKLALTGLLCAVVFIWVKPLAAGYFFLGMISVLTAGWVGLALVFQGR